MQGQKTWNSSYLSSTDRLTSASSTAKKIATRRGEEKEQNEFRERMPRIGERQAMKEGRTFLRSLPSLLGVSTYAMLAEDICTVVIARRYREHPGRTARWGREGRGGGRVRRGKISQKVKSKSTKIKERKKKKERNISTPVNTPHPHRKRLYSSEHPQTASRLLVNCQSAEKVKSQVRSTSKSD